MQGFLKSLRCFFFDLPERKGYAGWIGGEMRGSTQQMQQCSLLAGKAHKGR
jgi:hypothetical protein